MWGHVVEHALGWRAEHASVDWVTGAVLVPGCGWRRVPDLASELEGFEVLPWEDTPYSAEAPRTAPARRSPSAIPTATASELEQLQRALRSDDDSELKALLDHLRKLRRNGALRSDDGRFTSTATTIGWRYPPGSPPGPLPQPPQPPPAGSLVGRPRSPLGGGPGRPVMAALGEEVGCFLVEPEREGSQPWLRETPLIVPTIVSPFASVAPALRTASDADGDPLGALAAPRAR
jgi:hypothetical protein